MKYFILFLAFLGSSSAFTDSMMLSQQDQLNALAPSAPHLVINNRPLIKVNGKVISLIDVIKKMDMIIHEHFPEVSSSVVSLYQFYNNQWKHILEDMVFNELMILDAEQKEIKVSEGDVREEMERRFGPNIITTLSRLKLQYDEVKQIVHDEIVVRRIQSLKVYSKVQLTVTPEIIKNAYLTYQKNNPPKEEWCYQVLSVRGSDKKNCLSKIKELSSKLTLENKKLSEIATEDSSEKSNDLTINVSKEFVVNGANISEQHKKVLETLSESEYSPPILQTSRLNNSPVYRIFYLKSHSVENPKTFDEMYDSIYNKLLDDQAKAERSYYLKRLGKKFGFDEDIINKAIDSTYQPFALR